MAKREWVKELEWVKVKAEPSYYWSKEKRDGALLIADKIFFEKPVEAIYVYMKAFNVGYYTSSQAQPSDLINGFKKKFAKYIHVKHDTFTKKYKPH